MEPFVSQNHKGLCKINTPTAQYLGPDWVVLMIQKEGPWALTERQAASPFILVKERLPLALLGWQTPWGMLWAKHTVVQKEQAGAPNADFKLTWTEK